MVVAVAVHALVDEAHDPLDPQPPEQRHREAERAARRREKNATAGDQRQHDEQRSIQRYAPMS